MNIPEKIRQIEEEIRKTPYHKATEHHIGKLRAKLAKLREELISGAKKKKGARVGFAVKKQGDATVVILGFPSVGKSSLLNKLTNAQSKIAPYAFTTVKVIPGMMRYKGALLQLLDLPGIIEEASRGKGHGREILSVVRNADLLLLITEVCKENQFKIIEKELLKIGLVVNNPTADKRIFQTIPALFVINKIDLMKPKIYLDNIYYLSAKKDLGLENLKEAIWQRLDFKRIYLKRKGEKADFKHSLIVKQNFTIKQIAEKVSSDLSGEIKSAKIWQGNAKYDGQQVGLNFRPVDQTTVYLNGS